MNAGEYADWIEKAFLLVESALVAEMPTPSQATLTEDYLRTALLRGLMLSRPSDAHRVSREITATWSGNRCHQDGTHPLGAGRPLQHDAGVLPNGQDLGLVCEIKWLAQAKAHEVAADIWKLALSRSTAAEAGALRTYLLLGGEAQAFSSTLRTLRRNHMPLNWSSGQGSVASSPKTVLRLARAVGSRLGRDAWSDLVARGKHYRTSPACWASIVAYRRARWFRTMRKLGSTETVSSRAVLWEFYHRGAGSNTQVAWQSAYSNLTFACAGGP